MSQSTYSPGVVNDAEIIIYLLFHPQDIDYATLDHASSLIGSSKLKEGGISVVRSNYSDADSVEINVVRPRLARNERNKLCGCWLSSCIEIRSIKYLDHRAICVVDTALENYAGHASLHFSSEVKKLGRSIQLSVRGNLIDILKGNGICALEDAFN